MSRYHFMKLLILLLLFVLVLPACQSTNEFQMTPATSEPPTTSPASTANSSSTPTEVASWRTEITASATVTATSAIDVHSPGLLVFDQQRDSMGRLSVDGLQFQPLNQVPKLDLADLEYGLLTEQSGYFVSPDGQWLSTIIGYDQLILVNLLTDQRRNIARIGAGFWFGWSHDSQSLAYRQGENDVCVYTLVEETATCFNGFAGKAAAAVWSADDSRLALSVAGELAQDAPGVINGTVWIIDVTDQQTHLVAEQSLPLEGASASDLLVWTAQGLIVNHLLNGGAAALYAEEGEMLLAANAVSASPAGDYVIYENGRVEAVNNSELLTQLPVCAETESQTMRVVWANDENSFAYTLHCALAETTQLGIVRLNEQDLSWTDIISNQLKLVGWSFADDYLLFRRAPNDAQGGYAIERLGSAPGSTLETLAADTFLLGILDAVAVHPPQH